MTTATSGASSRAEDKGDRELFFDDFRLVQVTGADVSGPAAPESLSAVAESSGVWLSWRPPAADAGGGALSGLAGYEVLRGSTQGGEPELLNRFQEVVEPEYCDTEVLSGQEYVYAVRALDFEGNRGSLSSGITVQTGAHWEPRRIRSRLGE